MNKARSWGSWVRKPAPEPPKKLIILTWSGEPLSDAAFERVKTECKAFQKAGLEPILLDNLSYEIVGMDHG